MLKCTNSESKDCIYTKVIFKIRSFTKYLFKSLALAAKFICTQTPDTPSLKQTPLVHILCRCVAPE